LSHQTDGQFYLTTTKKREEAAKDLSAEEVRKMDLLEKLTKEVHFEMFLEEYDQQMDSISDAKDRRRGKNPMCAEHVAKVNSRRKALGASPLSENDTPTNNESWEVACIEAEKRCPT
jgi:hypothetical protein